jgi:hypothetical protein
MYAQKNAKRGVSTPALSTLSQFEEEEKGSYLRKMRFVNEHAWRNPISSVSKSTL